MTKVDFLIVGGSAAGTTAAETIRIRKPDSSITIVTDENHEEYSRVNLPHFVRHKVTEEQVFLKKREWYSEHNIELVTKTKAQKLDSENKTVTLSNDEEIQYGKLLIAVGAKVIPLDVPGADAKNILYFRTIEDAKRIVREAKGKQRAVIIGGGFIGLEFASCFKVNGVENVTMLVRDPYFWEGKLDRESGNLIVDVLKKNGVTVEIDREVDKVEVYDGLAKSVITKAGGKFDCDIVGVGIGVKSDFSWLSGSGVKIDRAIVANEYLETSVPDIYVAGDCSQFHDIVFERDHIVGNWANATSQGSAVGKTMAGERTIFETASSYSINFFEPPNNGSCSFIGVTDKSFADDVIVRGSKEAGRITQIFIKKYSDATRIVGATAVNCPQDAGPLTMVIKNKIDIGNHLADLSKTDFDLRSLIQ